MRTGFLRMASVAAALGADAPYLFGRPSEAPAAQQSEQEKQAALTAAEDKRARKRARNLRNAKAMGLATAEGE